MNETWHGSVVKKAFQQDVYLVSVSRCGGLELCVPVCEFEWVLEKVFVVFCKKLLKKQAPAAMAICAKLARELDILKIY